MPSAMGRDRREAVDADSGPVDLRSVMRNFATGVCVASTHDDCVNDRRHDAVTVNSLTSLSLDPPLVSLCLRRESTFLAGLLSSKKWAVSILDGEARELAGLLGGVKAPLVMPP